MARCADVGVCRECRRNLPWNHPACRACAASLPHSGGDLCASCLEEAPPFLRAWTAFRYESPIRQLVVGLKFHRDLAAADLLGQLAAERLARRPEPLPDLLIPVPLHAARLRRRGYNQALEFARPLARRLSMELAPQAARRLHATREQTDLSAAERRRNLAGAFAVSPAARGRRVALLDDVITTGSTVAELARAVLRAGAASVEAWAAARA